MTTLDNLKELERDMRKETHNLIASNYLSLEDLCECIEALEKQSEVEHKIKTKANMCESAYNKQDRQTFRDLYNDVHAHYDDAIDEIKEAVVDKVILTEVMYSHIDWSDKK